MRIRPGIEIAGLTDIGCHRETNEDRYLYWEPDRDEDFERLGRLAVVADGMGGHEGGQIASQLAVDTIQHSYANGDATNPQERLLAAFREANQVIQQHSHQDPQLVGMGTTCTAFALVGSYLHYVHIGDSRLYLERKGHSRAITRDHSLVARLLENGLIRPEDAENHPQRHVLTAALGVSDEIDPDFPAEPVPLEKSDVLLICTDGLWGQVNGRELDQVLSSQPPHDGCETLVRLAKDRGGPDNITLQIARVT